MPRFAFDSKIEKTEKLLVSNTMKARFHVGNEPSLYWIPSYTLEFFTLRSSLFTYKLS